MKTIKPTLTLMMLAMMTLSVFAQTTSLKSNEVLTELTFEDEQVTIKWSTSKEINTSYFLIEKSNDSLNYTAIKMVTAAGNSNFSRNYQFTETEVAPGKIYYRVTLVTMNGQQIASAPVPMATVNTRNLAIK